MAKVSKVTIKKILDHPDKDEIISKLLLDISVKDINEWLASKYSNINEAKFVLSQNALKTFKDDALDLWTIFQEDVAKTREARDLDAEISLSLQENPTYEKLVLKTAEDGLNVKEIMERMILAIELRVANYFDDIQENPRDLNSKKDRVFMEFMNTMGMQLERYYKMVNGAPDQVIQHNVTVQHLDQHVQVIQEAIRTTLQDMDVETSLRFMEIFNEKFSNLKAPNEKEKHAQFTLAEATFVNEEINRKLNEI